MRGVVFGAAMTIIAATGGALAQTPVQRGDYLVNSILTCGNCHTPRTADGAFDMAKGFSGGPQTWDEPTYLVKGSNITQDRETGIGAWSAADIKRALQAGERPSGVPLAPIMPFAFYKIFTPGDIDAVVAYLRTLPAVRNAVQAPVYKAAMPVDMVPGAEKPMSEGDLRDPLKRGFYLVTIGHCMECHTPRVNGRQDYVNTLGQGGQQFPGPWGVTVSPNITSHKTNGLGEWSDAEIKRAITQGISRDGRRLKPPMAYDLYARMTEEDVSAVVAYLRTVPARE